LRQDTFTRIPGILRFLCRYWVLWPCFTPLSRLWENEPRYWTGKHLMLHSTTQSTARVPQGWRRGFLDYIPPVPLKVPGDENSVPLRTMRTGCSTTQTILHLPQILRCSWKVPKQNSIPVCREVWGRDSVVPCT
jgi:hypothetical protein